MHPERSIGAYMKTSTFRAALCLLAPLSLLRADWPAGAFSVVHDSTGTWLARLERKSVDNAAHRIAVYKLEEDKKAFSLQRSITHVDPDAPNHALITNDGEYVVTFDSSGNIGIGEHVVVVYGKVSKPLKAWKLEEILTPEDLRSVTGSVSHRWWRQAVRWDSSYPHRLIVSGPKAMDTSKGVKKYTYTLELDELTWKKVE